MTANTMVCQSKYDTLQEVGGSWRFDRYILDADVIRPADGARGEEYDPWDVYRSTEGVYRTVESPYTAFLDLAAGLAFRLQPNSLRSPYVPTEQSLEAIVEWCGGHGLLGLLPARARRIIVAPEWIEPGQTSLVGPDQWVPGYRTYVLDGGVWTQRTRVADPERARALDPGLKGKGRPVPPDVCPKEWPQPLAWVWHWDEMEWHDEPLATTVAGYFPRVSPQQAERFPYPLPGTEEFWGMYGEPIDQFARWARQFLEAVEILSRDAQPTDDPDAPHHALRFLTSLSNTIGVRFDIDPTVHHVEASPSLLASYARMFLLDREAGRRVQPCHTCGKRFVSDEPRAQYCSRACRSTMQRRRQRKRLSEQRVDRATE